MQVGWEKYWRWLPTHGRENTPTIPLLWVTEKANRIIQVLKGISRVWSATFECLHQSKELSNSHSRSTIEPQLKWNGFVIVRLAQQHSIWMGIISISDDWKSHWVMDRLDASLPMQREERKRLLENSLRVSASVSSFPECPVCRFSPQMIICFFFISSSQITMTWGLSLYHTPERIWMYLTSWQHNSEIQG